MTRITRILGTSLAPVVLALLLGGATFAAAMTWLPGPSEAPQASAVETSAVLVADTDIEAGATLAADDLRIVQVPEDSVLGGALTSVEEAEGRLLRYPVSAGEQVLTTRLIGEAGPASAGLAFVVPDGLRAVSVPVTEITAAGGLIVPGDRVDVLAAVRQEQVPSSTGEPPSAEDEAAAASNRYDGTAVVTVLQDALVLAVGQALADPSSASREPGAQRMDEATAEPKAASVTLAVDPEEAQRLFMAVNDGAIGLALRGFGDTSRPAVTPIIDLESASGLELAEVAGR